MAEVRLDDVTKVFPGGAVAVDHVSLTVADGEFLVLVGPSGCGKSTVLRIIAGLEDATDGSVLIDGEVVNHLPPKERDIAMVFQNYALYPHMTVSENLAFSLRLRKMHRPQIVERVEETAHVLGLEEFLARKPKALSGGQRQRVAMGRAIVREPRVFLMDEPLSNLDAKLRVSMRAELTRLHQRYATTTVYVTHDQVEAMTLGDRIAVLDKGRLQQVGTPDDLYFRPANVFVAGFMGSPAMNLARARLVGGDPPVLEVGAVRWPLDSDLYARVPGLAARVGADVTVGLRPDAFTWPAGPDEPTLTVRPVGVESLGNEKHVLFPAVGQMSADGGTSASGNGAGETVSIVNAEGSAALWTAMVRPGCPAVIGEEVTLGVDLTGAYFFDPTTNLAIAAADAAVVVAGPGGEAHVAAVPLGAAKPV
jgi:multiple sugar transport system ATP-binding protein